MPELPIYKADKDKQMLRAEYEACEENWLFDTNRAIRTRAMTRKAYYDLKHKMRRFLWNLKRNKFEAGLI